MDRKEFCDMLKETRVLSRIKITQICDAMKIGSSIVYRMENANSDFSMIILFDYLRVIGCKILLKQEETEISLRNTANVFRWWEKEAHKTKKIYSLSEKIKIDGEDISIDSFLSLAGKFGWAVEVKFRKTSAAEGLKSPEVPLITRGEFCATLREARRLSGVRVIDICFAMMIDSTRVRIIETGKHSLSLKSLLDYLLAIQCKLVLTKGYIYIYIGRYEDSVTWLKNARKNNNLTQQSLAEVSNMSRAVIEGIEQVNHAMKIDSLLKLTSALGYEIKIVPIAEPTT